MTKYRKKPVVIDAVQYVDVGQQYPGRCDCGERFLPHIHTLEGIMGVIGGDWIITGVNGEHYPCKPDIFDKTYEKVEEKL